jgi:hypothetical protein
MWTEESVIDWMESRGLERPDAKRELTKMQKRVKESRKLYSTLDELFWENLPAIAINMEKEELRAFARSKITKQTRERQEPFIYFSLWGGEESDFRALGNGKGKACDIDFVLNADQYPWVNKKIRRQLEKTFYVPTLTSLGSTRDLDGPTLECDNVQTIRYKDPERTTCPHTDEYFSFCLISSQKGRALISLNGAVVGMLKAYENTLFLGLANVRDSHGRYPIVRGGIYSLQGVMKEFLETGLTYNQEPTVIDTNQLMLYPQRRLRYGNENKSLTKRVFELRADHYLVEYSRAECVRHTPEGEILLTPLGALPSSALSQARQSQPPVATSQVLLS